MPPAVSGASSSDAPSTPSTPPTKNAIISDDVGKLELIRSAAKSTTENGTRKLPIRISVGTRFVFLVATVTTMVTSQSSAPTSRLFHHQPCRWVRTGSSACR